MTRELPAAAAMFLIALCLYWLTLAPGLIGLVDTPKFQFVGGILGVPHPPGYPLYVLLSHGFSHLPFGSLAYRINLMSAVFGALTVALVFLCGRRAGAGRLSSGIGAFGLACAVPCSGLRLLWRRWAPSTLPFSRRVCFHCSAGLTPGRRRPTLQRWGVSP